MDDFELFIMDFLSYRRSKRQTMHTNEDINTPPATVPAIPAEIGKGWPHYKGMALPLVEPNKDKPVQKPQRALPYHRNQKPAGMLNPSRNSLHSDNEIICLLEPVVREVLQQFPYKSTADLPHLTHQVIAKAMAFPMVSESMSIQESSRWGRVGLMQALVEVLIISLKR
jgi:hypothetical protein